MVNPRPTQRASSRSARWQERPTGRSISKSVTAGKWRDRITPNVMNSPFIWLILHSPPFKNRGKPKADATISARRCDGTTSARPTRRQAQDRRDAKRKMTRRQRGRPNDLAGPGWYHGKAGGQDGPTSQAF